MTKLEADKLFNTGKKVYTKTFKIVYLPTTSAGEVIISAPIKIFKRANKRNRVKRLVREAIRGLDFTKNKNVFIIYNFGEIKSFDEIKSELEKIKI
jgi:ribonuclease P protein component